MQHAAVEGGFQKVSSNETADKGPRGLFEKHQYSLGSYIPNSEFPFKTISTNFSGLARNQHTYFS